MTASTPDGERVPTSAFRWMSAAGVALVVVLPAGWSTFIRLAGPDRADLARFGTAFTTLSDVSALALGVAGTIGSVAVVGGIASGARLRQCSSRLRPSVSVWMSVVALSLIASPILAHLNTVTMFTGLTLATRPAWWSIRASAPPTPRDVAAAVTRAVRLAVGVNVLAHVVAWASVFATAWPIGDETWARIHAERAQAEARATAGLDGGLDFIEMDGGYIAAGRSTAHSLSIDDNQVSELWLRLAGWMVLPDWADDPTERESWWIAAIAFGTSLIFWTPWTILWVWLGGREARRLTAALSAGSADSRTSNGPPARSA